MQSRVPDLTYSKIPGNEHLGPKLQKYLIKLDGKVIGRILYDAGRPISGGGPMWGAVGAFNGGDVIYEKTFQATLRAVRKAMEQGLKEVNDD